MQFHGEANGGLKTIKCESIAEEWAWCGGFERAGDNKSVQQQHRACTEVTHSYHHVTVLSPPTPSSKSPQRPPPPTPFLKYTSVSDCDIGKDPRTLLSTAHTNTATTRRWCHIVMHTTMPSQSPLCECAPAHTVDCVLAS